MSTRQNSMARLTLPRPSQGAGPSRRIEPEIDSERQAHLAERRAIAADIGGGIYPFQGMQLSRADVEWLLLTRQDQDETAGLQDRREQGPAGLDLRGANLRQANLRNLPLARLLAGRNWTAQVPSIEEQQDMARTHLEGADLGGAHLEEALLGGAHLAGAFLGEAHLEGAYLEGAHLEGAHLEGASLLGAHLEGASLAGAHLEGATLAGASLKGMPVPAEYLKHVRQWDKDVLAPADLRGAFFDSSTMLEDAVLGEGEFGFVTVADLHWGGANLSLIDWEEVTIVGDERRARQTGWLYNYRGAVRAYRQLATVLREQGLHEEALPFAYRAQRLQRKVLWLQMLQLRKHGRRGLGRLARKMVAYLFSGLLDLCAGYGYKPVRSLIAYLLVIGVFTLAYGALGSRDSAHLSWWQSFIVSLTAFHGRFFLSGGLKLSEAQVFISASEAFVGLVMEVGLIAIYAQRFFRK